MRLVSAVLLAFLVSVVWMALQRCAVLVPLRRTMASRGDTWIDISSAEFSFFKKDGNGWQKLANLRQPAVTRA